MSRLLLASLLCVAVWVCNPVYPMANAQCGANGTGQCGAPSAASLNAQQQLAQLQLNNGLALNAGTSASASSSSGAAPAQASPTVADRMPTFDPNKVYLVMPAYEPAPDELAKAAARAAQNGQVYRLAVFQGTAANGATAHAEANASGSPAPAALVPTPVNVPTANANASAGGCANGQCGGGGLGARLAAARAAAAARRAARIASRGGASTSTSIAISRTKSR